MFCCRSNDNNGDINKNVLISGCPYRRASLYSVNHKDSCFASSGATKTSEAKAVAGARGRGEEGRGREGERDSASPVQEALTPTHTHHYYYCEWRRGARCVEREEKSGR